MNAPRPWLDQGDLAEAERIVAAVASAFSAKVVGQNELRESCSPACWPAGIC